MVVLFVSRCGLYLPATKTNDSLTFPISSPFRDSQNNDSPRQARDKRNASFKKRKRTKSQPFFVVFFPHRNSRTGSQQKVRPLQSSASPPLPSSSSP